MVAPIPEEIQQLHRWFQDRGFRYHNINSVPRIRHVEPLFRKIRALGILRRQVFRVLPIDVRRLFPSGCFAYDPTSAILLAQAYLALWQAHRLAGFRDAFEVCIGRAVSYRSPLTRHFAVRANRDLHLKMYSLAEAEPSPLVTAYAGGLFLESWLALGRDEYRALCADAVAYFTEEHLRDQGEDGVYFYYHPKQALHVYNASAVISAFLVRAGQALQNANALELGLRGIEYVCSRQNADGSWFYGDTARYIDGFHSAFILDALRQCVECVDSRTVRQHFDAGMDYYRRQLFRQVKGDETMPKHFVGRFWPANSSLIQRVDLRDAALAVMLFARLAKNDERYLEQAASVLKWTNGHMRCGSTYMTEITWAWKNRIPYIEFQAWMFLALVEYYHIASER